MKIARLPQAQNLLLLGLLAVLCIYTALASVFALMPVEGEYSTIQLGWPHYVGFGAVTACLGSYFGARRYFRRLLGLTLLLALFNLANFLPTTLSAGFTFNDAPIIGLNPVVLLLLVAYYFLNRSAASSFIRKYLLPAPTPQQAARQQREAIDQFRQTFARKTDDSLRQIAQERKLVPAAVAAAQELLSERGASSQ